MNKRDWSKCHLCGSEMQKSFTNLMDSICPNECMKFARHYYDENLMIVDFKDIGLYYLRIDEEKSVNSSHSLNGVNVDEENYLERLNYWKENDRYLMKIMEGGK